MADKQDTQERQQSGGGAVNKFGNEVLDPTSNVLGLVQAAVKRLDDLRESTDKGQTTVLDLVAKHLKEVSDLRAEYDEKLRLAETNRIDAIRQVDVGNVQRAAEVQATQALALAAQVTASAEALRTQVLSVQTATATALAAALDPIQKSIDDLRRAQYEQQGQKTQVSESQAKTGVSGMWIGLIVAAIGTVIALILGIAGIIITLLLKSP